MKKNIIIILLITILNLNANELAWVNKQIDAIKPPRKGLDIKVLSTLKDPFIFLHITKKKARVFTKKIFINKTISRHRHNKSLYKRTYFSLEAIMNQSALINNRWYKLGDKISGYTLSKINLKNIILSKHHKNLLLSIQSRNKNLEFKRSGR